MKSNSSEISPQEYQFLLRHEFYLFIERSFYELMHSVLMQPDWICISSDEFIDVDAINSLWSPNSHLFAIHKYKYELPFPFLFRGLLSRCELLLLFRHFCNDPQSAKRGIKWTTSASLV